MGQRGNGVDEFPAPSGQLTSTACCHYCQKRKARLCGPALVGIGGRRFGLFGHSHCAAPSANIPQAPPSRRTKTVPPDTRTGSRSGRGRSTFLAGLPPANPTHFVPPGTFRELMTFRIRVSRGFRVPVSSPPPLAGGRNPRRPWFSRRFTRFAPAEFPKVQSRHYAQDRGPATYSPRHRPGGSPPA